jgi:hypothetical protein
MAPSTTSTSSRPARAAKNKAPALSATSTSAGGRKTQKKVTTTQGTKAPSKRGRKPTSTSTEAASTAVAAAMAKMMAPASGATSVDISAEDLAFYNKMTIRLAAADKEKKKAADLGAVVPLLLLCH